MALRTTGSVLVFLWSVAVVLGQNGWSVTYTTQSICALKGSTVELSCSYTYPSGTVTTTFWFTKMETGVEPEDLGQDPEYAGRLEYHGDKKNDHTLRITDLREKDSATYKFRFITDQTGGKYTGSPGVTLSVTGLQVMVTGGHQDKTLTCSTTCTLTGNPTYIWYKNGHKVKEDTSTLHSDYFSDAESYSCAVKGHEDLLAPALCKNCWIVNYTHQSICALKGSTVDISCSYTYPSNHEIKTAFWFTKWGSDMDPKDLSSVPGYKGHIEYLGDKKSDCTLRITDLRLSDSAGYRFRFITSGEKFYGSPVSLTVTDVVLEMDPTSVSERENVTLTCRTKCTLDPITVYSWYKNGQPIPNSNTYSPVYILFSVSSEDTGRYSCAVEGHEDLPSAEETLIVRYGPKNTSVSVSPSGEIVEGSSVTLTCSSDANPPVNKYTWYKTKYKKMSMRHSGQRYTIHNISSEDREGYYCEALNIIGRETIPVHINVISVFPWVPVVGVGAVLTAGALLVTIYCTQKRRHTGGSDATADTQSVHPDCNSDTYTGLNMRTMSADYDTLANVQPEATSDPNSDMYTPLNMKTRSPEYDTLANVRGITH
ncbi:B-cell receptor CD22-like isoform X2 [Salmo trutta]|uniref:B-cell receptor CD22-like isoform X2 n=1 Tax=Salmo trutta TaxID=8032 RepID=UPI0011308A22|nr:B-cell receptor CD22-like isoform X2 [Salmo trutta]